MTKKTLFILAIGSLLLFTLLGWGIMGYFGPASLRDSLQKGSNLQMQLGIGLVLGVIIGFLAWTLVSVPFFSKTRDFFTGIIGPLELSWTEIIIISCCAGIGEEILFRGGIQPHLGLLWTSILFVALHGYINPFNLQMTVYGVFMILAIGLIGWSAVEYGLIAAIVAHTVIDVILLYLLSGSYSASNEDIPLE
jgi:membrane protease YdiL (CAAX protease family)